MGDKRPPIEDIEISPYLFGDPTTIRQLCKYTIELERRAKAVLLGIQRTRRVGDFGPLYDAEKALREWMEGK